MKIWISAAAALLIAAPAGGQVTGAGAAGSQIETGQSVPDGKCKRGESVNGQRCICRRVPAESSSRMSLRNVCMTASQWRVWERER